MHAVIFLHTHTIKHVKNHCNSTQFNESGGGEGGGGTSNSGGDCGASCRAWNFPC